MTPFNVFRMLRVRSNSSLVSSSRPGSKANTIAFKAGRRVSESKSKKKVSKIDKIAGFTDRDAKDSVGAIPERYRGRSRARPSLYSSNP